MKESKTCGPMFLSLLSYFASDPDTSSDPVRLFSAGHMTGQAEKIYLGACSAAMFRPSSEYYDWMRSALKRISIEYGLKTSWLRYAEPTSETEITEFWLVKPGAELLFERLVETEVDSPEWHTFRGLLCGVPFTEVDFCFHCRKGYSVPCDRTEKKEAQNVDAV